MKTLAALLYFCKALKIIKPKVFFRKCSWFLFKPLWPTLGAQKVNVKAGYNLSHRVINCAILVLQNSTKVYMLEL